MNGRRTAAGLWIRTQGPDDGIPVLCLHGFLGEGRDWLTIAGALPSTIRWILPDLPGHGRSVRLPDQDAYHFEAAAQALLDILDASGVERTALVGYSMGGRLALYLALRRPERFSRVLLESASPGPASPQERAARAAHDDNLAETLRTTPIDRFLQAWYQQPTFASLANRQDLVRSWIAQRRQLPAGELARALHGMSPARQPNLWPDLDHLPIPAWFVAGKRDRKFLAIARRMRQSVPHARLSTLPTCGHIPHAEHPSRFTAILSRFLLHQTTSISSTTS
jgi:2-succinyl-6-hydroxy-2,4-cyclohexadiene-1-carboxylate synthase